MALSLSLSITVSILVRNPYIKASPLPCTAVWYDAMDVTSPETPPTQMPPKPPDNRFKRLCRSLPYLCVDTLHTQGVRSSATFSAMVRAVTNVHVVFSETEVGTPLATRAFQDAIQERVRAWNGEQTDYWSDLTARQLYTFVARFVDFVYDYGNSPYLAAVDAAEVVLWMDHLEALYPGISAVSVGDEGRPLLLRSCRHACGPPGPH